jgi:hypothetical protein
MNLSVDRSKIIAQTREGYAWTARLLADGRPVVTALDAGRGDCLDLEVHDADLLREVEAYLGTLAPLPLAPWEEDLGYELLPVDLDSAIARLADGQPLPEAVRS